MRLAAVSLGLALALCAPVPGRAQNGAEAPAARARVDAQTLRSGTQHDALFAVALSGDAGIAVGVAGELQESGDGGKTWNAVSPSPVQQSLFGVAIGTERAVAVGQLGAILVKPSGGAWSAVKSGTTSRLFAVGENASFVVAAGAFGTVIKSGDGGATWTSIAPKWADFTDGAEPHVFAVTVRGNGAITLAGEFGLILRSDDGGATWATRHKGEASLFGLDLHDDGNGYAVGQDGTVLRTRDDGNTWETLDVGSKANLLGVAFDGNSVFITGMHDILASTDGGGTWQRPAAEQADGWMTGVAVSAGAASAVAVGNNGRIVRFGK